MPITMPASPDAARSVASRCWAADIDPVISTTPVACSAAPRVPPSARSPSSRVIVWKCWPASTSVGASSAAWPPASTTASIARSATRVLPEPTSPCSSRCIGCGWASSAMICSLTSTWPRVSSNGSRASKASSRPPGPADPRHRPVTRRHRPAGRPWSAAARTPRRTASGPGPARWPPGRCGWCTARNAVSRSTTPASARTQLRQRVRQIPARESSASAAHSATVQVRSLPVSG